jgi:hypothetical protein
MQTNSLPIIHSCCNGCSPSASIVLSYEHYIFYISRCTHLLNHSFINGSTALFGPWPHFQFRNLSYTVGRTPWTGDQPVARPLPNPEQHKHRKTHTVIHASSGIRACDTSVRAGEDSSCRRPYGHCDRLFLDYTVS